jgi:sugar lactone lactonase YvrE
MDDRWQMYDQTPTRVATGWRFEPVTAPSRLGGSNGMTIGPDGRLYVTQVFASQVTAIDVDSGAHEVFSPLGGGIVGPDDGIFAADGTFFATEPLIGRVSARQGDGSYRVVRDDLPGANGITVDHAGRRLFVDEFRPGGRLMELDPSGAAPPRVLMEDLNGPNALAMGPDGRLYFPQVFANQIWVYDLEAGQGRLLVDDLSVPTAVKFDSHGRIVTSESGAGHITAIDLESGRRETVAEVPLGIDNVSVGPGDRIFVAHYVDGRVAEETAGRHRILSPPGFLGPHGLAVAADGRLLIADALSIADMSADATVTRRLNLLIDLPGLAAGVCPSGDDLLVATHTDVLRYPRGSGPPSVVVSRLEGVSSIVADEDGGALVVEREGGRVQQMGRDGSIRVIASGLHRPGAVARSAAGDLYVSQGEGRPVVVVAHGAARPVVEGLADAQGLAIAGDTLLVADVGSHELIAVDLADGRRSVAVEGARIGQPRPGLVPAAFCSVCADGGGGFYVGANGDGRICTLARG